MKKIKVGVFPAGTEIGLEINNALKFDKAFELFGISTVSNHAKFVYQNYIEGLGTVFSENFIHDINEIISFYKLDCIFPASDDVAKFLANNVKNISVPIVGSDENTSNIARSKYQTYKFFENEKFVPKFYNNISEINEFPVFCKPDIGAGSVGAFLAKDKNELFKNFDLASEKLVYTEYLPGKEYTIDCFTDMNRKLIFTGMRERRRIKNGISVNSITQKKSEEVERIACLINDRLNIRGGWFFQLKESKDNSLKLMEISTRIAGTMCLYRSQGINIPQLALNDLFGNKTSVIENNFFVEVDRALKNVYKLDLSYQNVIIDFDDTITFEDKVNPIVIGFLYQEINKGKKIYLVTRHKKNINETLESLKIDSNIFERIYCLNEYESKADIVKMYSDSIFIDDSFGERKTVFEKCNIPVFDITAIEALINN